MPVCPAREPGARPRAILSFEPGQPRVMRVLIVEEDDALAGGLMRTLRQSGYAVDHAESGELALRACAEDHYDLVVLDVSLPGIDGFEVLRQLRRDNHSGSILILTAHTAEGDRVRGPDRGAATYC